MQPIALPTLKACRALFPKQHCSPVSPQKEVAKMVLVTKLYSFLVCTWDVEAVQYGEAELQGRGQTCSSLLQISDVAARPLVRLS